MSKIMKMSSSKVRKVSAENYRVTTIEVEHALVEAEPGQFIMVWVPGVGEKPMSIGNRQPLTISVADVGPVSNALSKLKAGELISFRGPLGKPFTLPEAKNKTRNPNPGSGKASAGSRPRILVIGGGYGVVPMYFLARCAREEGVDAMAVIGGKSARDIIYEKQLFAVCSEVFITTDDGSKGRKGNVMAEVAPLMEGKRFDCVYCCGPERMMQAVAKLCKENKTPCQVSVERYMKCGVGVCGSCSINGKLCCVDGPVFDGEDALRLSEFGKRSREASGLAKEC
jgi:dihydroorotate dehydrogenase electron transfer subunit